jgi:hypothetical protein
VVCKQSVDIEKGRIKNGKYVVHMTPLNLAFNLIALGLFAGATQGFGAPCGLLSEDWSQKYNPPRETILGPSVRSEESFAALYPCGQTICADVIFDSTPFEFNASGMTVAMDRDGNVTKVEGLKIAGSNLSINERKFLAGKVPSGELALYRYVGKRKEKLGEAEYSRLVSLLNDPAAMRHFAQFAEENAKLTGKITSPSKFVSSLQEWWVYGKKATEETQKLPVQNAYIEEDRRRVAPRAEFVGGAEQEFDRRFRQSAPSVAAAGRIVGQLRDFFECTEWGGRKDNDDPTGVHR